MTRNLFWLAIACAVAWTLWAPKSEASGTKGCHFTEGGNWQLACTSTTCVICQDGECKSFTPGMCKGIWE